MSLKEDLAQIATELDTVIRLAERARGDIRTIEAWSNMAVIDTTSTLDTLRMCSKDARDRFEEAVRAAEARADRRRRDSEALAQEPA